MQIFPTKKPISIFENIAHIWRSQIPKRPPGNQAGPHDPDGDRALLELYEAARKGFPSRQGEPKSEPWSKTQLARQLTKTPEGRKRWGRPSQIVRRLETLINERNKQKKTPARRKPSTPTK